MLYSFKVFTIHESLVANFYARPNVNSGDARTFNEGHNSNGHARIENHTPKTPTFFERACTNGRDFIALQRKLSLYIQSILNVLWDAP